MTSDGQNEQVVISVDGVDQMIRRLVSDRRTVLGPTRRDGAIVHAEIGGVHDLPQGWTDVQDGGTYRLQETSSDELFAFSTPTESWKRFVSEPKTLLVRARRTGAQIDVTEPEHETPKMAFFGIRSCDLAGLGVLDRVMLDPQATDPAYAARRSDIFIVAAGCGKPGRTCFCASMNTGPSPMAGFDLAISELAANSPIDYLVTIGSARGREVLAHVDHRPATAGDLAAKERVHETAVAAMGRALDSSLIPRATEDPENPQWTNVADRCLACGNCTMVCPTCFCSTTEETTSLDGLESERWRTWDSCFTLDFTHMHGGSTRTSTASRYRQWLTHKLVTWHDQFDMSGCVGCGRCITWCPVGIDLTAEIAALAAQQEEMAK